MSADGIAKHLAGAQSAGLLDVLAGDTAATDDNEDLMLGSQLFQSGSVLTQARCRRGLLGRKPPREYTNIMKNGLHRD